MSDNANLLDIITNSKAGRFMRYLLAISAALRYDSTMTFARDTRISDPEKIPGMPAWITPARPATLEDVAFLSGAAVNHLQLV
mgnify:CR=1 FL=1